MNWFQTLPLAWTILSSILLLLPPSCDSFSNTYSNTRQYHTKNTLLQNIESTIVPQHHTLQTHPTSSSTSLQSSSIPIIEQALSSCSTTISSFPFTNDDIKQAFNVATFLPQPFWLLLIFIPNATFTKKVMGGLEVIGVFALVHLFIVITSALQTDGTAPLLEFNDVFNPSGDPQGAMINMMKYPNFVSEEWSHVLTWDLFIGRWIWLDGMKRGVFTGHSVLLSNLIGPPGLVLHWVTCLVFGKDAFPGNEALLLEEESED